MDAVAILIYTTVADPLDAGRLADLIVGGGLAACVQVVPGLQSVYRWNNEVKHDAEVQLIVKATASNYEAIAALLREHHPYELPEIIAVPIVRGSEPYLEWITGESSGQGGSWEMQ